MNNNILNSKFILEEVASLRNELKEKNLILNTIMESEASMHWDYKIDDDFLMFQWAISGLLGVNKSDFVYNPDNLFPDSLLPEFKIKSELSFRQFLKDTKKTIEFELPFFHNHGTITWIKTTGTVVCRNANNEVTRIIGTHKKILKHEENIEITKKQEYKYTNLIDSLQLGYYRTSPEGEVLMANNYLLKMLKFDNFEDLRMNLPNVSSGYVNSSERNNFTYAMYAKEDVIENESWWKTKDLKPICVKETAKAVKDVFGNILFYEGMVEDITDQKLYDKESKLTETKYKLLFEHSPISILEIDLYYFFVEWDKKPLTNIDEFLTHFKSKIILNETNSASLIAFSAIDKHFLKQNFSHLFTTENIQTWINIFTNLRLGKTQIEEVWNIHDFEKNHKILKLTVSKSIDNNSIGNILISCMDLTQSIKNQQELKETNNLLTSILDNTDIVVLYLDNDYSIQRYNLEFIKKEQLNEQSLVGTNIYEVIDNPVFENCLTYVFQSGESSYLYAQPYLKPTEKEEFWNWSFLPILNEEQQTMGVVVSLVNVTQNILYSQALAGSEAKLRSLIEQSPEGLVLINSEGIITEWNNSLTTITGVPRNEALYHYIWEIENRILRDSTDRESSQSYFSKLIAKSEQFYSEIIEQKIETNDGEIKFVQIVTFPIKVYNELLISRFVKDVTHRKKAEIKIAESEAKFRSIVEQSIDGILLLNIQGIILEWNKSMDLLLDIDRNEIIGKNIDSINISTHSDIFDLKKHIKDKLCDENLESDVKEFEYVKSTGEKYFLQLFIFSIHYTSEKILCCIFRNVTQIKSTENQLRELNATKDKLFSIIGHDLKNPFHVLMGFSELLLKHKEKITQEKLEIYLKSMNNSAIQGYTLLENLLLWSRAQTGTIGYFPDNFSLFLVVQEIIENVLENAKEKSITIKNNIHENAEVYVDINVFSTVIRNLLNNSIKFTNKGGTIIVSEYTELKSTVISVSDNGVGMFENQIEKLFNLNGNTSTRGTDGEKGSGVGLMLCKEFVEKMGGKLKVQSKKNKGTIFSFEVPVSKS